MRGVNHRWCAVRRLCTLTMISFLPFPAWRTCALPIITLLLFLSTRPVIAADADTNQVAAANTRPLADVLAAGRWAQVEQSVDHALAWLATQQDADGSFRGIPSGQPAV